MDPLDMLAAVDPAFAQKLPDDELCPRCGGETVLPEGLSVPFAVYCQLCLWTGPREGTDAKPELAIYAWNREVRRIKEAMAMGLTVNLDQVDDGDACG